MIHLRIACLIIMSVMLGLAPAAYAQENQPDALEALEEARAALAETPGREAAREAFVLALRKAILAESRAGHIESALSLSDELLERLDLALSLDPTDRNDIWWRYQAAKSKYWLLNQSKRDPALLEEVAQLIEADLRTLAKGAPNNTRYQSELLQWLPVLATLYSERADFEKATETFEEGVSLGRALLVKRPDNIFAASAVATGLHWIAYWASDDEASYERSEAAIPLFEDAVLAYKELASLSNTAQVQDGRSRVWFDFGDLYQRLGDDDQAFKAYRTSFHSLNDIGALNEAPSELVQRRYHMAYFLGERAIHVEDKIEWYSKAKELIEQAQADGHLKPGHEKMLDFANSQLSFNKRMQTAETIEEKQAISDALIKELEALGTEVRQGNIDVK